MGIRRKGQLVGAGWVFGNYDWASASLADTCIPGAQLYDVGSARANEAATMSGNTTVASA